MIIVLKFMEDLELLEIVDEIFHAADSLNMSRNLVTLTDCACAIVTPESGKTCIEICTFWRIYLFCNYFS